MFMALCIFLGVSVLELIKLFKAKEKKEAYVYIAILSAAVALAGYMMIVSDYTSFAKMMLGIFDPGRQVGK